MIVEPARVLRITYEAFSRFSNNLNRCRTFEDLEDCFTIHLKYLFNCQVFRASYEHSHTYVHLESSVRSTKVEVLPFSKYLEHETVFLQSDIPLRLTDISNFNLPESYSVTDDLEPELWGWNFINENRHILISVLGTRVKRFTERDVTFLKLVTDALEAKLLQLCLMQELDKKNNEITLINKHQKEIIRERTKEVENKNKALLEISILNAHNVREPLARILGLINLLDGDIINDLVKEILPMLKVSANDLDKALQNVINKATKDLTELKA